MEDPVSALAWSSLEGLERLLAQENNISDLLHFFSSRDRSPWSSAVGFVPDDVRREVLGANRADLFLTSSSCQAVVEVKLAHFMSAEQQQAYESIPSRPGLHLAALGADAARLSNDSARWTFLPLAELFSRWRAVDDVTVSALAREVASVVAGWDLTVSSVFGTSSELRRPLSVVNSKFLARVVSRRVAREVAVPDLTRHVSSGVTSGGGLPLVQAWTPVRGEGLDRCFMAEIRWRDRPSTGELRFGVDFDPRPGGVEDEEVRRAAHDLAMSMDTHLEATALSETLSMQRPDLADLLVLRRRSRPVAKGEWEEVVVNGLRGSGTPDTGSRTRRRVSPAFYGDGALRHQAIVGVDFDRASAQDVVDLLGATLDYLVARQPA